jgi:hypothetical protein
MRPRIIELVTTEPAGRNDVEYYGLANVVRYKGLLWITDASWSPGWTDRLMRAVVSIFGVRHIYQAKIPHKHTHPDLLSLLGGVPYIFARGKVKLAFTGYPEIANDG